MRRGKKWKGGYGLAMGGYEVVGQGGATKNNEEEAKEEWGAVFKRQLFVLEVWNVKRRRG